MESLGDEPGSAIVKWKNRRENRSEATIQGFCFLFAAVN
jgi:hypothetical protein